MPLKTAIIAIITSIITSIAICRLQSTPSADFITPHDISCAKNNYRIATPRGHALVFEYDKIKNGKLIEKGEFATVRERDQVAVFMSGLAFSKCFLTTPIGRIDIPDTACSKSRGSSCWQCDGKKAEGAYEFTGESEAITIKVRSYPKPISEIIKSKPDIHGDDWSYGQSRTVSAEA